MNEQSYTDTFYKVYRIYQFILMFHGMKDSMKKRDWQNTTRIIMLRLLLLSCFSHVWLCATPQMATHQVPLSLGFSRQEYWSGWPFLSPMQACMLISSVMPDSMRPQGQQPTVRLLHPWDSPGKNTGVGCHFLLQHITILYFKLKHQRLFKVRKFA